METPFNFTSDDKPEAPKSSGGGRKLVAGRYNFVFDRVANADDYADDNGIASGKNGWKALKLFFKLKQSEGKEKEIYFSETFCCDYDPLIKDDKGNSKRDSLVDMGQKKYKALCFVAGASLDNTDSLIGREFSCELAEGSDGYMELQCGAVGQNFGEPVVKDANDLDEPKESNEINGLGIPPAKEEDMTPLNTLDDEDIPF